MFYYAPFIDRDLSGLQHVLIYYYTIYSLHSLAPPHHKLTVCNVLWSNGINKIQNEVLKYSSLLRGKQNRINSEIKFETGYEALNCL